MAEKISNTCKNSESIVTPIWSQLREGICREKEMKDLFNSNYAWVTGVLRTTICLVLFKNKYFPVVICKQLKTVHVLIIHTKNKQYFQLNERKTT